MQLPEYSRTAQEHDVPNHWIPLEAKVLACHKLKNVLFNKLEACFFILYVLTTVHVDLLSALSFALWLLFIDGIIK